MFPIKVLGDNYSDGKCGHYNSRAGSVVDAANHTKGSDFMETAGTFTLVGVSMNR